MTLLHLGTTYGGHTLDIDRVPEEGTVIDAGIGTDLSFADALHDLRPNLRFIGIDHTEESAAFVAKGARPWYRMIRAALATHDHGVEMYRSSNPNGGSESMIAAHQRVNTRDRYRVPSVAISDLLREFNPCVVKLDVEGCEYALASQLVNVPQIAVEFHEKMMSGMEGATDRALDKLCADGYRIAHRTERDEVLLVKR